jgi:biotin carboxyl carrier protein
MKKEAIERRLDATKQGTETAKKNVVRQEELFKKGLSSPLGVENARLNLNKYLVDEANASAELARVQVKLARQLTQAVNAPMDGTILKLVAGQGGQLVKQGETACCIST